MAQLKSIDVAGIHIIAGDKMNTAVTELLHANGIPYRELNHTQPVLTIDDVIQQDINPDEMVKCILLRDSRKRFVMACLMGLDKLNPQAVRQYATVSRLSFASSDEIEAVTGSGMGAVAPVAHKIPVPVVFDNKIKACKQVNISSGHRQMGLELALCDLLRVVEDLTWGDIHVSE